MPPATPIRPIAPRIMSFAVTLGGSVALEADAHRRGRSCGRLCVASTCSTSEVPTPNASAPNAPCVEVWLSPQTIVMPGWVRPELRADHVDDPLAAAAGREERDAELLAVAAQRVELRLGERIGHRPVLGRHVVIHRRERQVGPPHAPVGEPQAVERLGRGDLMDQVQVDEEHGGLALGLGHEMALPDPLEQRLCIRHASQAGVTNTVSPMEFRRVPVAPAVRLRRDRRS